MKFIFSSEGLATAEYCLNLKQYTNSFMVWVQSWLCHYFIHPIYLCLYQSHACYEIRKKTRHQASPQTRVVICCREWIAFWTLKNVIFWKKSYRTIDRPSVGLLRNVLQTQSDLILYWSKVLIFRIFSPLIVSCAFPSVVFYMYSG